MNTTDKVKSLLPAYCDLVTKMNADRWTASGFTHAAAPVAVVDNIGKRYARIAVADDGGAAGRGRYVHSFIDMDNGDILKGSWKAPVKNGVRGSIFSDDLGASKINWHGPIYLR